MPDKIRSLALTVAWGLFCACSWTWCVGLFLPNLMIDRFGFAGVIVFAVPNVLGCTAFGYVIATPQRSRRLVERHGTAMLVFSLVAVTFQVFFVAMFLDRWALQDAAPAWMPLIGALVVFMAGGFAALLGDRGWLLLSLATYVFSLVAFGIIGVDDGAELFAPGFDGPRELVWIGPIVAIGFLLCPYLDLTFHRSLQRSPSRHAFAVFGVAFTAMLALTCFLWYSLDPVLRGIGTGHILAQIAFTIGAHLREARKSPVLACAHRRRVYMLLPLLGALVPLVSHMFVEDPSKGIDNLMYIRFLAFYALVFPAYIVVFMGPWRPVTLTKRNVLLTVGAILLLAPLFELGFLWRYAWLLAVPLAVLAAWGVTRWRAKPATPTEQDSSAAGLRRDAGS